MRYLFWLFELYYNFMCYLVCFYCYRNLYGYLKKYRELWYFLLKEKNLLREVKCNLYFEWFGFDVFNILFVLCKCINGIKGVLMIVEEYF